MEPVEVPVLMYHEIADASESSSPLAVSPAAFQEQLEHLCEAGYISVTADAFSEALRGKSIALPQHPVVLTFDDGFADFHSAALPLLQRYGVSSSLYVTTSWVAHGQRPQREKLGVMLAWSQVLEAVSAGVEVGAHSHTHPQLDQLPQTQLRSELRVSRDLLEEQLGKQIRGLAYPFGYSSPRVREAAAEAGYTYACAVGNAMASSGQNTFAFCRLTVKRSTSMKTFKKIVKGQCLPMIFGEQRALTKGWAVIRRARVAVSGVERESP